MEFQEVMRERFTAVIEGATGRHVIGFMSGNQQNPDMMCEVFVLAPDRLSSTTAKRPTAGRRSPPDRRYRPLGYAPLTGGVP